METVKVLVVPDVHGRLFWTEEVYGVLENTDDVKVVFLGDYLDPYDEDCVDKEYCIKVLDDIIELKKKYRDRVILIIGNHDYHYFNGQIGGVRKDLVRKDDIRSRFVDNMDLFEYYHIETVGGVKYLFSHAGFLKCWLWGERRFLGIDVEGISNDEFYELIDIDFISKMNFKDIFTDKQGRMSIGSRGPSRGGYDIPSFLWADVSDHLGDNMDIPGCVQVYAHTRRDYPIHIGNEYCLDCAECFYIFESGLKRFDGKRFVDIPDSKNSLQQKRKDVFDKYKRYISALIV